MLTEGKLIQIGNSFFDTRNFLDAAEYYRKAIEINPYNDEAYVLLGISLFKNLDIENSLTSFDKAIEINSSNDAAWYNKGEIYLYRNDYLKAKECFKNAIGINPGINNYEHGFIKSCYFLKDYPETIAHIDRILSVYPGDLLATYYRGLTLGKMKDFKEAIKSIKKYIELKGRTNDGDLCTLGYFHSKAGDFKKAQKALESSLHINPTHPYSLNNLGYVQFCMGNYKEAVDLINYSIEIAPSNSYAYKNRSLVYIAIGEMQKAHADLRIAKSLGYEKNYDDEVNNLLKKHFNE